MSTTDELLTCAIVGLMLGVTVQTISAMIRRGDFKAVNINPHGKVGRYRIPKSEVESLLQREIDDEEIARAKELIGKK